jgi:hypothetical protein
VGGDGDERCLRRLIESAKSEFLASPRRISPALYTIDDVGKVVPLVLPVGHLLADEVAVGHVMMATSEYDAQRPQLQEQVGEEIFVASYKGLRADDGSVVSYTTWTKGIPSLLPLTDHVALVFDPKAEKGGFFRVTWQVLLEIAGDCLALEPDVDPPRWRTTPWPEEAVLARLRAAAIG